MDQKFYSTKKYSKIYKKERYIYQEIKNCNIRKNLRLRLFWSLSYYKIAYKNMYQ